MSSIGKISQIIFNKSRHFNVIGVSTCRCCRGSGSAAVVSYCYQLAWILAVSRDASEVLRLEEMAEIQARSQPPIFFRQVEDGDRRCQSDLDILWRQNCWERHWCLNSNALLTFANVFVALNFVTLLDFSEQNFLLETVMRNYFSATRLSWIKSLRWFVSDNKVDLSSHITTKK